MKLILGSSSAPRREVLESHGYIFEVVSPNIDEKAIRSDNYHELPLLLARAKAQAILSKISEPAFVITADQVTICNGDLHEKPADAKEAKEFLNKYSSGKIPQTVSAIVVTNTENGKQAEGVDIASIHFDPIPEDVVNLFIETGDPYSKSGGFTIEPTSPLKPFISKIDGDNDSVMGLPLKLMKSLLEKVQL